MYCRSRTIFIRPLVLLLLVGASTWAQEAEQFTLLDGRVILGNYDPLTKMMRAQTTAGVIVFVLEPERIASRAPVSSAAESEVVTVSDVKPTNETREYYVREKRRLDDQLHQDRRSLYKDLGPNLDGEAYLRMRHRVFELKRAYDTTGLAFRVELDGERKRALGEQWTALDQQYSNLLTLMKRIEGERSIVLEGLENAERIYREQLVLLEKIWIRDGHGQPPIQ